MSSRGAIVFDLGDVVVTWQPSPIVASVSTDPADRRWRPPGHRVNADLVASNSTSLRDVMLQVMGEMPL